MRYRFLIFAAFIALVGSTLSYSSSFERELFRVFPNPVVDNAITVEAEYDISTIEILSIVGQIVQKVELEPSNSVRLSINLQPGVYLIRITFTNKASDTKRIWVN